MNSQHLANWINSGMAQEAAQSVAWMVFWLCLLIGVVVWRDCKKENNPRPTRNVQGGRIV